MRKAGLFLYVQQELLWTFSVEKQLQHLQSLQVCEGLQTFRSLGEKSDSHCKNNHFYYPSL